MQSTVIRSTSRRGRAALTIAFLVAGGSLGAAVPAQAAATTTFVSVVNGQLQVVAGASRNNEITVTGNRQTGVAYVRDAGAGLKAGAGCFFQPLFPRVQCSGVRTVFVDAGSRSDTVRNRTGYPSTLVGGLGNDTITGGSRADVISGGVGTDTIDGASGDDIIRGGDDRDVLIGGPGKDAIYGDGGNDSLSGGSGGDLLAGGAGRDTATYAGARVGVRVVLNNLADDGAPGEGDRVLTENVIGSGFGDVLIGGDGDNALKGAGGNDSLRGGKGSDRLVGGRGDDTLSGGAGVDTLDGGLDRDRCIDTGVGTTRIGCELVS